MGECGTSVILQWPKHRSGIDLVASRSEETAAVVAAEIVTERRNRAAAIGDAAGVKDGATELQSSGEVGDPAAKAAGRVAAEGAVENVRWRAAAVGTEGVDPAAVKVG